MCRMSRSEKHTELQNMAVRWISNRSCDKDVDKALKSIFHDNYHKTAPLEMRRADVQLALAFSRGEYNKRIAQAQEQYSLLEIGK